MKFFNQKKFFLVGLILTSVLLWPLLAAPYFTHHDDVQAIRLYEMDKCFKDNQIPCRWVPDLGGLYGYPLFNYYGPLPYYTGEIFYTLTHNLIDSAKMMFGLSFLGSYILMYLLARKLWGEMGGTLSAVFYSYAPYHAVDFYVRGAMGEMWGLMFYPAVLWALLRLSEKPKIGNSILLTLFFGLLILSHNLSTMIFMPVILVFIGLLYYYRRQASFLWYSFGGLLGGFMLAAFYFLPMLFEKNLVHVDTTIEGYFSYTEHFKGLRKLFIDRFWGWGPSIREVPGGEKDGMSYQIGWIHLIGWVISLWTAKVLWPKKRFFSWIIILSSFIIISSIFMIHPRSDFVWKLIDPLKYLQFPWRFLMLIILFISLISGSLFKVIEKFNYKLVAWVVLIIAVISFNFSYFRPEKFIQINDQQLLSGVNWDKQIKRSIFDYLPIFAKAPPADLAKTPYEVLTGDVSINNFQKGTNWYKFQADAKSHSIVRLSQYYFPNWRMFDNGKEIPVDYKNNDLGLMTFIIGEGQHTVEAKLFDTPIRTLANFITLVTLGLIIILSLLLIKKVRNSLGYYIKGIS